MHNCRTDTKSQWSKTKMYFILAFTASSLNNTSVGVGRRVFFFSFFSWTPSSTKKRRCHGTFWEIFRLASVELKSSKNGPSEGVIFWSFRRLVIFQVSNADSSRILSLIISMFGISGSSIDCSWACFARESAHWLPTTENFPQVCWSMWDGIQWIKKVCEWVSDEARCLISWIRKKYLFGMIESHKVAREKALSVKKWISESW